MHLCMILYIPYLSFIHTGAAVFGILEEGWLFADAAYFAFISVSTVGFGDMVPGIEGPNDELAAKLAFTGVYILIGILLI